MRAVFMILMLCSGNNLNYLQFHLPIVSGSIVNRRKQKKKCGNQKLKKRNFISKEPEYYQLNLDTSRADKAESPSEFQPVFTYDASRRGHPRRAGPSARHNGAWGILSNCSDILRGTQQLRGSCLGGSFGH